MLRPRKRHCLWCDAEMFLDGDRWICSSCAWTMPNREICPRCWAPLPEEEGPGGEKICPDCGYELWPPRDMPNPPKEVWYKPPGLPAYKVSGPEPTPLVPVPKKTGGRSRKSKRKSPLQQRWEEWKRKNPMRRRIVGP